MSSTLALLFCEIGARVVWDRVDYLSPTLVRDDILGIRLPGGSGGHDSWGFRNSSVPVSADIVALGDSHTYGNCAKMNEAWPKVLGQLTGKSVYNLGMGGYGPNQYYHLLKTRAIKMKPRTIVCGLYMGDDFDNAYRITYGLNYWSSLRRDGLTKVDADIWEKEPTANSGMFKGVRNWLSGRSVLYRVVIHGLLGNVKGRYQVEHASEIYTSAASLILPEKNISEAFLPKGLLRGLDQEQESVKEGMRITFELLKSMNDICNSNQIQFIVAVIPTKETVFAQYLEHNSKIAMGEVIDQVVSNERIAREKVFKRLGNDKITFVDVLPLMNAAKERERLYTFGATDMHPNCNGYRIIAAGIAQYLERFAK